MYETNLVQKPVPEEQNLDLITSFDCPCHGSRYIGLGKVVTGPANAGLEREEVEHKEET